MAQYIDKSAVVTEIDRLQETTMDYEKKYKEAQGWIEKIYPTLQHEQQMEAEAFFPELKESEDEKIRKALVKLFQDCGDTDIEFCNTGFSYQEIFTWLEKQEGCEYIKKDWLEHIKQSWYKEGFIDGKYSGGTLSEEEQNRFAQCVLTSCASSFIDYLDAHKYEGKMCVSNGECEDIENAFHNAMWDRLHRYYCKYIEKQGEQKPASKVEPKFKVGDWIVTRNGNVNQVVAVDKDGDGFTLDDDTYFCGPCKDSYWTIQDAKDGDVLACPLPKGCESGEQIFIFKGINSRDYVDNCIEFYCRVHEGVFYENENDYGYMGTTSSPIYPATKEQRETLIKAMTDAGYTFDFENKELKKIAPSNKELEGKL